MRLSLVVQAALASASSLTPGVLPLIVRNPYLSTWLQGARDEPWARWPMFWTGGSVGFSVMASVPEAGKVYPLLGRPQDSLPREEYNVTFPEYLGAQYDASTTNLTYRIAPPASAEEPLTLTLSFLSPITPASTLRQSLPAGYLTVHVEGAFDVDLYVDLNGEWVSGNRDSQIRWELSEPGHAGASPSERIKTWKVARSTEQLLTEFADRAEWGTLHFSAPADVHHQSGTSAVLRQHFSRRGRLANEVDGAFRRIMEQEPVFAFSKSFRLGGGGANATAGKAADSVLFTFALVQDPVVQFAAARGLTYMRPYWASFFPTADAMVRYHYDDFGTASRLAGNYSDQLAVDAYASGSQEYRDIATLSARQVLGATQFSGTPESPILFLKEISSNGNFQTVDVIFPAFPFFLYTNPRWLAYLLEPLLEHQLSGQYPNQYSMHDLGYHFPNATGHADGRDEYMPVEECGNMLIMGLALANALKYDTQPALAAAAAAGLRETRATGAPASAAADAFGMDLPWGGGDGEAGASGEKQAARWASRSYRLWEQWTGYLVRESLVPANQLCTDDFAGWLANNTNLALKGIVGIRAMAEIADLVGERDEARRYRSIAAEYVAEWRGYGISRDGTHAKLAYTWYGSWTTLYNLYADALLCFHLPDDGEGKRREQQRPARWWQRLQDALAPGRRGAGAPPSPPFIPDDIYKMHSDWYHAVLQAYGLPLDSRHLYAKSDWEFFAAAVTSKRTRTEILGAVARWVNETKIDRPLSDLYETEAGGFPGGLRFMARPVVGGHFAFLALERACGGRATEALRFLDADGPAWVDVAAALAADGPGRPRREGEEGEEGEGQGQGPGMGDL